MSKSLTILLLTAASSFAAAQHGTAQNTKRAATSVTSPRATLLISGTVMVNHRPVTELTSTVFDGDQIQTSDHAAARVSAPGLSVYLPANSCLKYRGNEFEMCSCGSVDIIAMRPASVIYREKDLVVSSASPDSAFSVSLAGRDLRVGISKGYAEVAHSGSVLEKLASGSSKSFAGLGCSLVAVSVPASLGRTAITTAPAAISAAVIKAEHRAPLSSITP